MNYSEKAYDLHQKRYNCCQSVLLAFSDIIGIEEQMALRLTAGFGGGMQTGEACGAVVGALLVLGSLHYFDATDPEGPNGKTIAATLACELQTRFQERFHHLRCEDLLKDCYIKNGICKAAELLFISDGKYCDFLIVTAAEIVTEMIDELKIKNHPQKKADFKM